jgi:hypothetical protein|tara:strand:- start:5416 stop:6192 length:777 start_codon:yes stop_codon:yes gene_type:complete
MNQSIESSTQVDESSVSKISTEEKIAMEAEWKVRSMIPSSVKVTREGSVITMIDGTVSIGKIHVIESTQWQHTGKYKIMWDRWDNNRPYDGTQIGRAKIEYGSPTVSWMKVGEWKSTINYVWNMEITKAISEPSKIRSSTSHQKIQDDWIKTVPKHRSIVGAKVIKGSRAIEKCQVSIKTPKNEDERQAMMTGTKNICPPTKAIMKIAIESDVEVVVGQHRVDTTSYSHKNIPVITVIGSKEEVDKVIKKITGNPFEW